MGQMIESWVLEWPDLEMWISTAVVLLIPLLIAMVAMTIARVIRGRPKFSLEEVLSESFKSSSSQ